MIREDEKEAWMQDIHTHVHEALAMEGLQLDVPLFWAPEPRRLAYTEIVREEVQVQDENNVVVSESESLSQKMFFHLEGWQLISPEERRRVAFHEAAHVVLAHKSKDRDHAEHCEHFYEVLGGLGYPNERQEDQAMFVKLEHFGYKKHPKIPPRVEVVTSTRVQEEATKAQERVNGCFAKAREDEPLFVLRAKDVLAPELVLEWVRRARARGVPEAKVQEAEQLCVNMLAWQEANGSKTPD